MIAYSEKYCFQLSLILHKSNAVKKHKRYRYVLYDVIDKIEKMYILQRFVGNFDDPSK